ncbi:hypothetical protein TIFTF001_030460 [Ficus carica]|uniref:Uncharacterized protein n=1 Tax=Ficus carica TaxID=3494 RepID=A0AA88DTH2_FICCA|nr:hypothetical protein TIFTF001_030460 [Ficus carica]
MGVRVRLRDGDRVGFQVGIGFQDKVEGRVEGRVGFRNMNWVAGSGYKTEIEVRVRFWDEVGLRDGGWGRVSGKGRDQVSRLGFKMRVGVWKPDLNPRPETKTQKPTPTRVL